MSFLASFIHYIYLKILFYPPYMSLYALYGLKNLYALLICPYMPYMF